MCIRDRDLTLVNHGHEPMDLEVRLEAASDFADLFEVKDKLQKKGELYRRMDDGTLTLGYKRGRFERETRIVASQRADLQDGALVFRVRLEPHQRWSTCVDVLATIRPAQKIGDLKGRHTDEAASKRAENLARWSK